MEENQEKELIRQFDDPQTRRKAFEVVVNSFSEQLYWQIRRMVLSHEDTNDLLQNTFIKAWTNLDSFRGEARISTWLYRIAVNECITFLNKQKQMTGIPLDDVDGSLLRMLEAPEEFSGDDLQKKLQTAILQLPDKQRLVFNMKYYQEMKYEEISDALGTSVGALKASYHYAVKKIEDFFANND